MERGIRPASVDGVNTQKSNRHSWVNRSEVQAIRTLHKLGTYYIK